MGFISIEGGDLPHLHGEYDIERMGSDLAGIADEPGLVIELHDDFYPSQMDEAFKRGMGALMGDDRDAGPNFPYTNYTFMMARGLVVARKQAKFDQLSHWTLDLNMVADEVDKLTPDEIAAMRDEINENCPSYADATNAFIDTHADKTTGWPTIWLGFGFAYKVIGRQIEFDRKITTHP